MNRKTENKNEHINERGNAIFMILVAVALFAALGYAVTNSSRTSTTLLTDEEATAYANQMMAYGNEVKTVVRRLQLRGCDETEISFENNIVTGYINPNAPSSNKCHVFDIAGGGLTWQTFDDAEVIFSGANVVSGVGNDGTNGTELNFFVRNIPTNTCITINDNLGNSFTVNPPVEGGTWGKGQFVGDYVLTNSIRAVGVGLDSLKSACFEDDVSENVFYTTLIVR